MRDGGESSAAAPWKQIPDPKPGGLPRSALALRLWMFDAHFISSRQSGRKLCLALILWKSSCAELRRLP